jgi:hypothetical protein
MGHQKYVEKSTVLNFQQVSAFVKGRVPALPIADLSWGKGKGFVRPVRPVRTPGITQVGEN